nr:K523 [uncultured bacterium]
MAGRKSTGVLIAGAAAALFAAGGLAPISAQAEEAMVHCMGVNACKGKSDCATANNGCKGQNACKGKGFTAMTEKACVQAGGTVEAPKAE